MFTQKWKKQHTDISSRKTETWFSCQTYYKLLNKQYLCLASKNMFYSAD